MHPKDIALAPLYLYQGLKLKHTTLRLPEAEGKRHGVEYLNHENKQLQYNKIDHSLNLMLVGDSAAAGVGVQSQDDAMVGHLLNWLTKHPKISGSFSQLQWAVQATSGYTSFDLLRQLYITQKPKHTIDVMIVVIGANDTTSNTKLNVWQQQLEDIIAISQRKFAAQHILFSCLPPMNLFPAIPTPLNQFIGKMAGTLDASLQKVCAAHDGVTHLAMDFSDIELSTNQMFATDGFHPSSLTYEYWATQIGKTLIELI